MNSPPLTFQSDLSTPKPEYRQDDLTTEDFSKYLTSLIEDINALGIQTQHLRSENHLLKKQLEIIEKEKEKHIKIHAKEKQALEQALDSELQSKKELLKELKFYKEKYELLTNKKKELDKTSVIKKSKPNIKGKLIKMEKEQKMLKRKIKELEVNSTNRSAYLRYDTEV